MGNWLEVLDSETKIRAVKLIEDFKGIGWDVIIIQSTRIPNPMRSR